MNMIWKHDIGMQRDLELLAETLNGQYQLASIVVRHDDGLPVITSLEHMVHLPRHRETGHACHLNPLPTRVSHAHHPTPAT
jgi:hypothetical protein